MKPFRMLPSILQAIGAYLLVWAAVYVVTLLSRGDRPSIREGYEYFILAWTFQAGELPGFIWLVSVVAAVPLFAIAALSRRRRRRGDTLKERSGR